MRWVDGNTYKGYWEDGIQNGIGLMIFADGVQRAGFFVNNVYSSPLMNVEEIERYETRRLIKLPEAFKREIKAIIEEQKEREEQLQNDELIGK